jgi:predicted dehydrogenase
MEAVRIGVVGAGYMGRSFAKIVADHPGAQLAGIADLNVAVAREAGVALNAPAYASVSKLIQAGNLDGLIVATVEHAHRESCVTALEQGIGVLVEKPLATTIDDGQAIIAAAETSGAPLLIGHVLRFDARYARLKEAVAGGQLGEPLTMYARRLNGKRAQDRLKGRCSLPLFLGVHDYDIARWVAGGEVVRVMAQSRFGHLQSQGYAVEDATWALLTFDNGVLAAIEEGWILPNGHPSGVDQRFEVNGSAGRAEVTGASSGLTIMSEERESWPDTALWPTVHGRVTGALEREVGHFIRCLKREETPFVTGADGLAAVRIALAVEESARAGTAVNL